MIRWFGGLIALTVLGAAGCLSVDGQFTGVPGSVFGFTPTPTVSKVSYAPASLEFAARVDTLGRKIIDANPQLAVFSSVYSIPIFRTIGSPTPEIFHRGAEELLITEGLVKQCQTDGQLAAVLSLELGKMVAERLAETPGTLVRDAPPLELRVGNSNTSFGDADELRRAEMAKFQKMERQRMREAATTADPRMLASVMLTKAGFAPIELDNAAPVLALAADNRELARQLLNAPPVQIK
jgi:hypothetical protein